VRIVGLVHVKLLLQRAQTHSLASAAVVLLLQQDFKAAAAIWHTVVYLSFPQLHNTMAALAAAWGFDIYAWMHADAVVLKSETQVRKLCPRA